MLDPSIGPLVIDLCDPRTLVRESIAPDRLAASDRRVTQGIAGRIHAAGHPGSRWWSALTGGWHTVVLFTDRIPLDAPTPTHAEILTPTHPAVLGACEALSIRITP